MDREQLKIHEKERERLIEKWKEVKARQLVFSENAFVCPLCKRPFEEHDIANKKETLIREFNEGKAKELEDINRQGASEKVNIERLKKIFYRIMRT